MTAAGAVLAHGLGGSNDLPVPYTYALIGAAWALTFTFALVALAWSGPGSIRPSRAPVAGRGDDAGGRPRHRWAVAGRGCCSRVGAAGRVVRPAEQANPLPGVFYVLLWVGLVAPSLVFGPVWRVVSPLRTVYLLLRRAAGAAAGRGSPPAAGLLPAAFGLFAFVWLELASPELGLGSRSRSGS